MFLVHNLLVATIVHTQLLLLRSSFNLSFHYTIYFCLCFLGSLSLSGLLPKFCNDFVFCASWSVLLLFPVAFQAFVCICLLLRDLFFVCLPFSFLLAKKNMRLCSWHLFGRFQIARRYNSFSFSFEALFSYSLLVCLFH